MNAVQRMLDDINMEVKLTRNLTGKDALDERVLAAMRQVPRHQFIPGELSLNAYDNRPLPIGAGQTISQPYIVALMTDLLNPEPGDTILEIGTGSGYQAAVLSPLVRQIYSIEIIETLADKARTKLKQLNYPNIEIRAGDGYCGWPQHAPYDGIIVTAAAPHIPEPLVDQLKPGARLVIPVGLPYQYQVLMTVGKKNDGSIETRNILGVSFVPLTGKRVLQTNAKFHS